MYNKIIREFVCSETEPVVETKAGKIRGYKVNDVFTFLGVRYAVAERFLPSRPVPRWEGVVDTQDYGYVCPTRPETTTAGNLAFPKRYWLANENCQYLNIWTKHLGDVVKQPVVVWLHGGGFTHGSCLELECYDGENMCRYGDVVQVSLNHRLNIYGYLDLSDYGSEYENSGIAGMEDIVAALRWVQDNIAQFGGDPDNVTIFGESGGGAKVRALMQMACADGLYHRAIINSGILPDSDTTPQQEKESAKQLAAKIVRSAGGLGRLRQLTNTELLTVMDEVSCGKFINWSPVPCTGTYIGEWFNAGFRKETLSIPVIVGSVFMELVPRPTDICEKGALSERERYDAVAKAFGENAAPAICREFEKAYPEFNMYYASLIDCMVRRPTSAFCLKRVAAGGERTYNFVFAHETYYKGGLLSTHADELAFVFHNVEYMGALYGGEETFRLQDKIFYSFMAFAANGDPNNDKITEWKPVCLGEHNCFVFSKASGNRVAHDEVLMELVAKRSRYAVPHFLN